MTYNAATADRVRERLESRADFSEKKMFGGLAFLLAGNMCCGVWQDFLICRVGPDAYAECLTRPGAGEFDITGRPMKGWVMVAPNGFATDRALQRWIAQAADFAASLPAKAAASRSPKRSTPPPRRRRLR